MKEQWIDIEEFSRRSGKNTSTIYSEICRGRDTDPMHDVKYKKVGNRRYVNWGWFSMLERDREDHQRRFEDAYWTGMEMFPNEFSLAKAISEHMDVSPHSVSARMFYDEFKEDDKEKT